MRRATATSRAVALALMCSAGETLADAVPAPGALPAAAASATAGGAPTAPPSPSASSTTAEPGPPPAVTPLATGDPAELPARSPVHGPAPGALPGPGDSSPPRPLPRGRYVHDGVFARLAVGPGWFQASSGHSPDTRTFSGGAVSIDAAVGGAPARGLIIGAAFETNRIFSLSSSDSIVDGDEPDLSDTRFSVTSLSLLADYYPDPTEGLHVLAAIGTAWLDVSHSRSSDGPTPTGPIFGLGGGYEWFVGPEISLGVLLRGNLGLFTVNETGNGTTHVTAFVPALLATATYN